MTDELTRLRAENERLREALRDMANRFSHFRRSGMGDKDLAWDALCEAESRARAALQETSHDG